LKQVPINTSIYITRFSYCIVMGKIQKIQVFVPGRTN
jgi:hypothetical protein